MQQDFGFFLGLLRAARCAGKHALRTDVNIEQLDAVVGEDELANLVRMRHATGLEHPDTAIALAITFEAAQQKPCVHQGRDANLALLGGASSFRQAGKKSGDLLRLKKID